MINFGTSSSGQQNMMPPSSLINPYQQQAAAKISCSHIKCEPSTSSSIKLTKGNSYNSN